MRKITIHGCLIGGRLYSPGAEVDVPEALLTAAPQDFADPATYQPPGAAERKTAEEHAAAQQQAGQRWLEATMERAKREKAQREAAALDAKITETERLNAALKAKRDGRRVS